MPLFRSISLFGLLLLVEVILLLMFLLFTMSYIIRTKRFIWKVLRLLVLYSLGINLFIRHGVGIVQGLPPRLGINGLVAGMVTGFTIGYFRNKKPILQAKEELSDGGSIFSSSERC
jgi:hypothetical protein